MLDSPLPSEPQTRPGSALPAAVRGDGSVRASFADGDGGAQIVCLAERGGLRLRFPRVESRREAVLVNTGGGITGGDRLAMSLEVGASAQLVATSQAAEKIYRTDGPPAHIRVRIHLDDGACLAWLPQETIVFDRASAERTLDVEMAATARLTLLECVVLGRIAHGERLHQLHWHDRWRIRRDGRLVLAEDVRLDGDVAALMERPAVGGGARAIATLVHIAGDAEARLDEVRAALADAPSLSAASAWNGMLLVRFVAEDPRAMRAAVARATTAITRMPMPRAWSC